MESKKARLSPGSLLLTHYKAPYGTLPACGRNHFLLLTILFIINKINNATTRVIPAIIISILPKTPLFIHNEAITKTAEINHITHTLNFPFLSLINKSQNLIGLVLIIFLSRIPFKPLQNFTKSLKHPSDLLILK